MSQEEFASIAQGDTVSLAGRTAAVTAVERAWDWSSPSGPRYVPYMVSLSNGENIKATDAHLSQIRLTKAG